MDKVKYSAVSIVLTLQNDYNKGRKLLFNKIKHIKGDNNYEKE